MWVGGGWQVKYSKVELSQYCQVFNVKCASKWQVARRRKEEKGVEGCWAGRRKQGMHGRVVPALFSPSKSQRTRRKWRRV